MNHTRFVVGLSLLSNSLLFACGGARSAPTAPVTPVATPTPQPTATPDPDIPPAESGCRKPYPPPISRFNSKVHYKQRDYWMLDSTPIVGPDANYCRAIGYTDGRGYCPVRPEGAPDRVACEFWRVGRAADTGQPGPTWTLLKPNTLKLTYCTGVEAGCERQPDNAFQVHAIAGGLYKVCTEDGVCGQVDVERGR